MDGLVMAMYCVTQGRLRMYVRLVTQSLYYEIRIYLCFATCAVRACMQARVVKRYYYINWSRTLHVIPIVRAFPILISQYFCGE